MKRTYRKYFVVFMDILGYKNLVESVDKNEKKALQTIDRLEHMIKKCINNTMTRVKNYSAFPVEYILFSDSLCIFVPIDESEDDAKKREGYSEKYLENNYIKLNMLCRLVADIQLESLQFGIIYRGAISLGNHFSSKNLVFSKALINAYLAESTKAIYPRVIILDDPENDLLELAPLLYETFDLRLAPDDDFLFVDYLGKIEEFYGFLKADCDYIKWHKRIIEQGIKENIDKENYLKKYAWMMNYHHSKLAPLFGKDILINDDLRRTVIQKFGPHAIDFLF